MKKQLFTLSSILIGMAFSSMVYANPVANNGLETITMNNMSSSEYGTTQVIDHNPTSYSKSEVNGHVLESWVKNNIAYTAVDGNITKQTTIDNGLEKSATPFVNSNNHSQYGYSNDVHITNNTFKAPKLNLGGSC
ncbi:hypothetical protein [Pectinatus brassicae]|uniref:Uncharacterized protein n=1 Tax=Pectinatus brassicae TaxID=862415 RepID=A0A840UKS2_9FIRM|nr:hypothetical protein [Pectinatus brassicae]MBB5336770.1 hypothetical protein [Pectinatus brassicae]